jgi:hypothetical protein
MATLLQELRLIPNESFHHHIEQVSYLYFGLVIHLNYSPSSQSNTSPILHVISHNSPVELSQEPKTLESFGRRSIWLLLIKIKKIFLVFQLMRYAH